jgi:hypothetical protein
VSIQQLVFPRHHGHENVRNDALHQTIDLYSAPVADGENWLWLANYREEIRRQVLDAYVSLASAAPDPQTALTYIQDAIRLGPYNEDVYRRDDGSHQTRQPRRRPADLRAHSERLAELEIASRHTSRKPPVISPTGLTLDIAPAAMPSDICRFDDSVALLSRDRDSGSSEASSGSRRWHGGITKRATPMPDGSWSMPPGSTNDSTQHERNHAVGLIYALLAGVTFQQPTRYR